MNGPPVVLWADTFTNYFKPERGRAAVAVLEDAGFNVHVPREALCCGRPLYDYGMLDTAKSYLRRILTSLQPAIEAGVPLVGLEPSCVAVFRDELTETFDQNADAQRLHDQAFTLSEFLRRHASDWTPPHVGGKALVHFHCHQKCAIGKDDDVELLKAMGIELAEPEKGCCGLAGSFGFEAGKYGVSMAIGEQRLLPAVRQSAANELLVADGFSCQTQIEQGAGRKPVHLAQVIASALPIHDESIDMLDGRPARIGALGAALLAGGAIVGTTLLWRALSRSRNTIGDSK